MAWAPDYATLADLRGWQRVADTVDDDQMSLAIAAASRAIDTYCRRQFGLVAVVETRTYLAEYDRRSRVVSAYTDDLMTTTGLVVVGSSGTVDPADYVLAPVNAAAKSLPWTEIQVPYAGTYTITARWGWTSVPDQVVYATLLQASRFLVRRDSPYGIAGSPDQGSEQRLMARVDPDVMVSLARYRRTWGAR